MHDIVVRFQMFVICGCRKMYTLLYTYLMFQPNTTAYILCCCIFCQITNYHYYYFLDDVILGNEINQVYGKKRGLNVQDKPQHVPVS